MLQLTSFAKPTGTTIELCDGSTAWRTPFTVTVAGSLRWTNSNRTRASGERIATEGVTARRGSTQAPWTVPPGDAGSVWRPFHSPLAASKVPAVMSWGGVAGKMDSSRLKSLYRSSRVGPDLAWPNVPANSATAQMTVAKAGGCEWNLLPLERRPRLTGRPGRTDARGRAGRVPNPPSSAPAPVIPSAIGRSPRRSRW